MNIYLNEKFKNIKDNATAFEIRSLFKNDADVLILNGHMIKEDIVLSENDKLTLIKKGEVPLKEDLESLMVARHTPGVHEKVKNATVGIAGLGGLGSNIAISLARLGVGKLVLVDFDVVEPSNLNRQQYYIRHIGMKKTDALKEIINEINPYVELETKDTYLDESNVASIFKDADIVVEAFDNPLCKAILVNTILTNYKEKYIVSASGVAGYFSNNNIKTKKAMKNLYVVGDGINEAKVGCGLMAPRVAIAANHQANTVLRIILGELDV